MALLGRALALLLLLSAPTHAIAQELQSPCQQLSAARCVRWLRGEPCVHAADPVAAVRAALSARLVAQDAAIAQVVDAVAAWDEDRRAGRPRPLVLALTGSTGVGKSQTALTIAAALLVGRIPPAFSGGEEEPDRVVKFNGANFAGERGDAADGGSAAAAERVRAGAAQGLYECSSGTVVIFDEAQKVHGSVLGALSPLMQSVSPSLEYGGGSAPIVVSGPAAVFVIVSDVGVAAVEDAVAAAHAAGDAGGRGFAAELAALLRDAMAHTWAAAGHNIGALPQAVVPFLPFNQSGVTSLLGARLRAWAAAQAAARGPRAGGGSGGAAWDDFVVEDADGVAALLSDPTFTAYGGGGDAMRRLLEEEEDAAVDVGARAEGARGGDRDGVGESEVARLRRIVCIPPPPPASPPAGAGRCAPCAVRPQLFVKDGARAVVEHGEGPLRTFEGAVRRALAALPEETMRGNATPQQPVRGGASVAVLTYDEVVERWLGQAWADAAAAAHADVDGDSGDGDDDAASVRDALRWGRAALASAYASWKPAGPPSPPPTALRTRVAASVDCGDGGPPDARLRLRRCVLQAAAGEEAAAADDDAATMAAGGAGEWGAAGPQGSAPHTWRWREVCAVVHTGRLRAVW